MSQEIIEVVSGDNAIKLGLKQFARTLSIGNTWNEIYIVMRYKLNNPRTFTAGKLLFGVQNGTTNLLYDPSGPGNFWGMYQQGTWTYNSGTPDYFSAASNLQAFRKRGTTFTTPTNFISVNNMRVASTDNHTLIGFGINKTTPTATTFRFLYPNSTSVSPSDMSNADFLAALDESVLPANYAKTALGISAGPWDVDEATYGNLDTVCVAWRSEATELICTDLGVSVIS